MPLSECQLGAPKRTLQEWQLKVVAEETLAPDASWGVSDFTP